MPATPLSTAAVGLIASLLLICSGSASAQDFEPPNSVHVNSPSSGCMVISWKHSTSGVNHYTVERENPPWVFTPPNVAQQYVEDCNLEPDTVYRYQVCAFFITTDGDVECADWTQAKRTRKFEAPRVPQPPPTPIIGPHDVGPTWIGIRWEAGFDYDSYFVNTTEKPAPDQPPHGPRTIHHDDDGTWGYQRVDGLLPGRTYWFNVQGCTKTFFGLGTDNCWEWSATYEASTPQYTLHHGPDTCAPPFVWREAFAGDHVCVESGRRTQVATDNTQGPARRAFFSDPKNGPFTVPDTCRVPFVWREARPSDHVCVSVEERKRVAAENALANQRRAKPRNPGRPAPGSRPIIRPDSPPVVK